MYHRILAEEAARGYDLLVAGDKGMTGTSRFLLGSVPNMVRHHAACPRPVVPSTG